MAPVISAYEVQDVLRFAKYGLTPCVILIVVLWYMLSPEQGTLVYYYDYENGGILTYHHRCTKGKFSLPWMDKCVPWLTCTDIESNSFEIGQLIGSGAVKVVHKAKWNEYEVVLNNLINVDYKEDFRHGLKMLIGLQPDPHVTQLVGYCKNKFVTQLYPFGSADNLEHILNKGEYEKYNSVQTRFQFCLDYAEAISFLHNSPLGTRVMCDSNDLSKTLSQFLITSDFRLVINDVDALPLVNHSANTNIKCGSRQIFGDFAAPEQLWDDPNELFDSSKMEPYDEKTDIYKIPDVCEYFLGDLQASEMLKFHLFKIHKSCKSKVPYDRPSAMEVYIEYNNVWGVFMDNV